MHVAHDKNVSCDSYIVSLFMMLLKVIMREGNMVICILIILSFPSLCWESWSCACLIFLCLLHYAYMTCLFTRFLFIGSGLGLNLFWICFLMLSFASTLISCECIIKTAEPILMAIKKRTSWEITHVLFCYSTLFYICVLEVVYYCSNLSLS